jgi:gamma-glutamyltranspeptidase
MTLRRTGRQPVLGLRGVVAAPHHAAAQAGLRMLQRGGSAVDAAIAANAVLCVVYPHMAGVGGDLFCLLWDATSHRLEGLNASGRAAEAATPDFYQGRGHETIPIRGPLAALTVPGAVDGWWQLHARLGRLPFSDLFEAAVELARDGFPVPDSLAAWSLPAADLLERDPTARATFRPEGRSLQTGQVLRMPRLAETLQQVARGGPDAFYRGTIAERACAYLAERGGPLTPDDFARHRSDWVDPISVAYRGHTAYQLPPNTQGFAALQLLAVLEGIDVAALEDESAPYIHTLAEVARLVFEDRDRYLSDPAFVQVPLDRLLSPDHAAAIRSRIDPDRRSPAPPTTTLGGGDTCYLCAVDRDGNAVSLIQSVFYDFGSGVVAGDTGMLMQNRGAFFSLDPDHPNRLEPGKRPFHTIIPAMLFADGRPSLVYGTMGGEGQPQTQAALVTRMLDFGYDVQRAIEAPRWLYGRTWGAATVALSLENDLPFATAEQLAMMGYDVRTVPAWSDTMGHAQAIQIDHATGVLRGGADPRSDGAAAGW